MQIKVDSVSDIKTNQYGTSGKIKSGNDFYYVNEDPTPFIGKALEVEVTEKTSAKGGKYKIAKVVKVIEPTAAAAAGNGNGHISWDDYRQMAEAAHDLAVKLEPDGTGSELGPDDQGQMQHAFVDRSTARAAILNTVMIAFSNGKIANPMIDDDMPF